jgi:hypothetical protein
MLLVRSVIALIITFGGCAVKLLMRHAQHLRCIIRLQIRPHLLKSVGLLK